MPTPTLEEYLETIYKLSHEGPVRPTQIADSIGVSGPTVTATLKRLVAAGLVRRSGTEVVLTDAGMVESLSIVRKHRVAERFLVDVLGLDWEEAHEDACLLEHALSNRVLEALEGFLDNPDVCPHGHPIPSADGQVRQTPGRSLAELREGESATVLRVSEDNDVLGYLGSMGLVPGAVVCLMGIDAVGGLLALEVAGSPRTLSRDMASHVTVGEAR